MFAPPEVRLPPVVRRGEVIPVYVKFRRPTRTGLKKVGGRFVRVADPQYVRLVEARYRGQVVFRYEMTEALADNVLVSFKLRASDESLVTITAVDDREARVEVNALLRFGG